MTLIRNKCNKLACRTAMIATAMIPSGRSTSKTTTGSSTTTTTTTTTANNDNNKVTNNTYRPIRQPTSKSTLAQNANARYTSAYQKNDRGIFKFIKPEQNLDEMMGQQVVEFSKSFKREATPRTELVGYLSKSTDDLTSRNTFSKSTYDIRRLCKSTSDIINTKGLELSVKPLTKNESSLHRSKPSLINGESSSISNIVQPQYRNGDVTHTPETWKIHTEAQLEALKTESLGTTALTPIIKISKKGCFKGLGNRVARGLGIKAAMGFFKRQCAGFRTRALKKRLELKSLDGLKLHQISMNPYELLFEKSSGLSDKTINNYVKILLSKGNPINDKYDGVFTAIENFKAIRPEAFKLFLKDMGLEEINNVQHAQHI